MDLEQISAIQPFRVVFPNLIKMGRYLPIPFFNKVAASGKRLAMYPRKCIERYKQILAEHPENPKLTLFTKVFDAEKSGMTETDIQHELRVTLSLVVIPPQFPSRTSLTPSVVIPASETNS
jgi:hypothetical protein